MTRSSHLKKGHPGDDRLPQAPYHGCLEVDDMGNRIEITGASLYIVTGLGWLAYSLLVDNASWLAGAFRGVFD